MPNVRVLIPNIHIVWGEQASDAIHGFQMYIRTPESKIRKMNKFNKTEKYEFSGKSQEINKVTKSLKLWIFPGKVKK